MNSPYLSLKIFLDIKNLLRYFYPPKIKKKAKINIKPGAGGPPPMSWSRPPPRRSVVPPAGAAAPSPPPEITGSQLRHYI